MCTPWFSINPTQFYDRSATLAATSLAALIVMTACGAKDAQAHSVRAVALPPFLWTDVSPTQAQGIATALSEELGRLHDFGHDTFLGSRFSAGAANHPFRRGVIADVDDNGSESRSGQRNGLRLGNASSLGTASDVANSVLDKVFSSGASGAPIGGSGGSGEGGDRSVAGGRGSIGNQNPGNSVNGESDIADPPLTAVPLPPAFPLFAFGLFSLIVLVRPRKSRYENHLGTRS